MNKIGRKIFYDIINGNVILDKGEMQGGVVEETIEEIVTKFTVLSERNRESFDVLELPFGAYQNEFSTATSYRINPTTKELEFNYDPLFDLEQYKTYKIGELINKCEQHIIYGFTATNGNSYRLTVEDQLNMQGQKSLLDDDTTITEVVWLTMYDVTVVHTKEEWLTVYSEAFTHKNNAIWKNKDLREQVKTCTTKEEVEAIVW